jgi:benzodiazapine receptor
VIAKGSGRGRPIAAAAAAAIVVGALGALVTDLSPWYYGLRKPSWQPPDWLFGPAWTLIFALAALAGVYAWRGAVTRRQRLRIALLFTLNAVLNIAWSWLFFRAHRPDWALAEVTLLWLSIAVLIAALAPLSKAASALLVPYLLWVTFAAFLNWTVVRLNAPFATG